MSKVSWLILHPPNSTQELIKNLLPFSLIFFSWHDWRNSSIMDSSSARVASRCRPCSLSIGANKTPTLCSHLIGSWKNHLHCICLGWVSCNESGPVYLWQLTNACHLHGRLSGGSHSSCLEYRSTYWKGVSGREAGNLTQLDKWVPAGLNLAS